MVNIIIPMAGAGKRFAEKGYTFPKPLIEINGRPMIEWVVRNLTPKAEHRFIFVCLRDLYEKYKLNSMLQIIAPNCKVVVLNAPTAGAACTVLLAKEFIDGEGELVVAGSDQYVDFDINKFLKTAQTQVVDGLILTFKSTHPKWSFAKVGKDGLVMETAEKDPISDNASAGIYYFRHGGDFVVAAENMIKKDIRSNNEFFICPVYNELILQDKKVKIFEVATEKMFGWATPEDLESFIKDQAKMAALK